MLAVKERNSDMVQVSYYSWCGKSLQVSFVIIGPYMSYHKNNHPSNVLENFLHLGLKFFVSFKPSISFRKQCMKTRSKVSIDLWMQVSIIPWMILSTTVASYLVDSVWRVRRAWTEEAASIWSMLQSLEGNPKSRWFCNPQPYRCTWESDYIVLSLS